MDKLKNGTGFEDVLDAVSFAHRAVREGGGVQYVIEWRKAAYWTVSDRKPLLRDGRIIEVHTDHSEHIG